MKKLFKNISELADIVFNIAKVIAIDWFYTFYDKPIKVPKLSKEPCRGHFFNMWPNGNQCNRCGYIKLSTEVGWNNYKDLGT